MPISVGPFLQSYVQYGIVFRKYLHHVPANTDELNSKPIRSSLYVKSKKHTLAYVVIHPVLFIGNARTPADGGVEPYDSWNGRAFPLA